MVHAQSWVPEPCPALTSGSHVSPPSSVAAKIKITRFNDRCPVKVEETRVAGRVLASFFFFIGGLYLYLEGSRLKAQAYVKLKCAWTK